MVIVIDAYNVLKLTTKGSSVSEHAKQLFIKELGRYGKKSGNKLVVVFDGGPYEWPVQERRDSMYVVHSGVKESADDYIKRYLDGHKAEDLLLVSTDRALGAHASHLDIESLDAHDFYMLLQQKSAQHVLEKAAKNQPALKVTEREHPELDILMQEGSKVVPRKSEDILPGKKARTVRSAQKPSKKERRLLKKIKKL